MLADAVLFLADSKGPANVGPDFGKAGPFGLAIVVLLMVGTFFLIRSMNRHLGKLPDTFDPEHPEPDQEADEGTVAHPEDAAGDAEEQRGDGHKSAG